MNNHIFEIIQDINGQVGLQWEEKDKQELAELIVKECVHTVRNRGGMCGALASDWIEEHFYGVEE